MKSLLVGRQFGDCGYHTEIRIAFGQIELTQLLLVECKAIRVNSWYPS